MDFSSSLLFCDAITLGLKALTVLQTKGAYGLDSGPMAKTGQSYPTYGSEGIFFFSNWHIFTV